jgi:hypothetical protein
VNLYSDIVRNVEIKRFRRNETSYEILAVLFFRDESELHFREYVFKDGTRKYAYHWQTKDAELIGRWDNAPHWPELKTFPHHFHNTFKGTVEDSTVRNLEAVLAYLREYIIGRNR